MCGIVGAASARNIVPVLIDGVRRLEYRGYDSTGLAVIDAAAAAPTLSRLVSTARVADLAAQAESTRLVGTVGISHTRWATHGAPTPVNAHPHTSGGEIAVVHNGIIENYEALRARLRVQGYVFATETDTEVIAHLVHSHWHAAGGGDLKRAVQAAIAEFHGRLCDRGDLDPRARPDRRRPPGQPAGRGLRRGRPLSRLSDAAALLSVTRRVAYLEEGDVADVRRESCVISDARGERVERAHRQCRGVGRQRRAGALPALHAEGDLRAAARGVRHARRRRRHRPAPLRARRPPMCCPGSTAC